jgi:hypothetical protein
MSAPLLDIEILHRKQMELSLLNKLLLMVPL